MRPVTAVRAAVLECAVRAVWPAVLAAASVRVRNVAGNILASADTRREASGVARREVWVGVHVAEVLSVRVVKLKQVHVKVTGPADDGVRVSVAQEFLTAFSRALQAAEEDRGAVYKRQTQGGTYRHTTLQLGSGGWDIRPRVRLRLRPRPPCFVVMHLLLVPSSRPKLE